MMDKCPNCKAVLTDRPIPEKNRWMYPADVTHYTRLVAIVERGKSGVQVWKCPDCDYQNPARSTYDF